MPDYLPANTAVVTIGNIQLDLVEFYQQVTKRYEQYGHDISKPLLKPERLFLKPEQVFEQLKGFEKLRAPSIEHKTLPDLRINTKLTNPLLPLEQFLSQTPEYRILFCVESAGRREALLGLLAPLKLDLTTFDKCNKIKGGEKRSLEYSFKRTAMGRMNYFSYCLVALNFAPQHLYHFPYHGFVKSCCPNHFSCRCLFQRFRCLFHCRVVSEKLLVLGINR